MSNVNWNEEVSRLFADTNFLLDCASLDRPRHETAMKLQRMAALGLFEVAVKRILLERCVLHSLP